MSKFKGIFQDQKDAEKAPATKKQASKSQVPPAAKEAKVAHLPLAAVAIRRGRPAGKRSDPDFEAITAYIRKKTHKDVKIALLQEDKPREFSQLVEELLINWLKSNS